MDDNKLYTIATIDYLADGNDGMNPLVKAENRDVLPELLYVDCSWIMWSSRQRPERRLLLVWKEELQ